MLHIIAATDAAGINYGLISLIITLLIALIGVCIWTVNKKSSFNSNNLGDKRNVEDELNEQLYKRGAAPLVRAVSAFMYEQIVEDFSSTDQEVISKYEQRRSSLMDPNDKENFINLSNLPESVEYDELVEELVAVHQVSVRHDEDYTLTKKYLTHLMFFSFVPVLLLIITVVLYLFTILVYKGEQYDFNGALVTLGFLAVFSILIEFVLWLRLKKKEARIDNYLEREAYD